MGEGGAHIQMHLRISIVQVVNLVSAWHAAIILSLVHHVRPAIILRPAAICPDGLAGG